MDLLTYLGTLFLIVLILSFLLVRYYASRRTSITIQLLTTISFAVGFSGTLLLPIDLSLNVHHNNGNDDNDDGNANGGDENNGNYYYNDDNRNNAGGAGGEGYYNGTILPWHILFWSTSILAWGVLPIVKEMLLSGQFTLYNQFQEGVRKRLRFVFIVGTLLIIGIIWLAIYLHSFNVIPLLITLANTYGLLLVSLLLGYGLIALPRSIWNAATPEYSLRKLHIMTPSADEALFEAVWDIQDIEYDIDCKLSHIVDIREDDVGDVYYCRCVEELVRRKKKTADMKAELQMRRVPMNQRRNGGLDSCNYRSGSSTSSTSSGGRDGGRFQVGNTRDEDIHTDNRPSMEELISLNRRLKCAQENLYNTDKRWESIVDRSRYFHGIIHKWTGKWIILKYLRIVAYRFVAVCAMWLSGVILWSEATLSLPYNLTPFALVQEVLSKKDGASNGYEDFLFQLAALVPLVYMSLCVSSSIFKLTMFGPFALRGYRQSHGVALVLNSQFLARLIFPLGYNYLLMLKYDTSSCAFSTFIGQMEVVPLFGTTFSVYAPLLIIALCVFTLFNIYPKIMNLLRIEHEDAILLGDQETIDLKVSEGTQLLRRRHCDDSSSCEMHIMPRRTKSDDSDAFI